MENDHVSPRPARSPLDTVVGDNCLVTGANGFLGRHMVPLLLDAGASVIATGLADESPFPEHPRLTYVQSDLTKPEDCELVAAMARYQFVFHFAALNDDSATEEELRAVNVGAALNLLDAVDLHGSQQLRRFVYCAAGGVYDFTVGTSGPAMREDSPFAKNLTPYLATKLEAEARLKNRAADLQQPFTVIRPGRVYGPGDRTGLGLELQVAAGGGMLTFYVGPQDTRVGAVHVEDVCRAMLFVALRADTKGETFNVNDDSHYTTAELIRKVSRHLGFPLVPKLALPLKFKEFEVNRHNKRARKLGRESRLTNDMIALRANDAQLDASALKALGFKCAHPDTLAGLIATVDEERKAGRL